MKHRSADLWLASGRAVQLPSTISEAFDDYINALPWAGTTGLDWSRMPASRETDLARASPDELYEWILTTRLGSHSHMSVWYSRAEGGLVVPLRDGIVALDELYLDAPGPRFSFGLDLASGVIEPAFDDLVQYGLGDLLIATA